MKQLLLFITIPLFFSPVYCCTCIGESTFKEEFKRSDVVLIGRVIDEKTIEITDSLLPRLKILKVEYTIHATKIYKGKIGDTLVKVVTGGGGGDCGFLFTVGNEYIIYCSYQDKYYAQGNRVSTFLYTDYCRRTRLANDAEELSRLSKKRDKRIPSSG